jgi:hypothetical protein
LRKRGYDFWGAQNTDLGQILDGLPMCGTEPRRQNVQMFCIMDKWRPVGAYQHNLQNCAGKWQPERPDGRCFSREAADMDFDLSSCCMTELLQRYSVKVRFQNEVVSL